MKTTIEKREYMKQWREDNPNYFKEYLANYKENPPKKRSAQDQLYLRSRDVKNAKKLTFSCICGNMISLDNIIGMDVQCRCERTISLNSNPNRI